MIICKGKMELDRMREANLIVAEVLTHLGTLIKVGVTTAQLNTVAEEMILKRKGRPAFKGYQGYPAALCASVNDQIVHGIPNARPLREGDIIALDVGVNYKGFYGDSAWTFPVGEISEELKSLLAVTRESLYRGIEKVVVGNRVSDISYSIQEFVEAHGFSVVREFVGHGIGKSLHEEPQVPNYGKPGRGPRLVQGMVLAIEPMVNSKGPEVRVLGDKWTAVTADGGYSAHFEHSVAVTGNGPWILSDPN
ncbi:type I methionyl aminopeptidase [Acidobacteria bacterium AH-259-A15]|nr:type I methionyl aminopeptidase [Acidobacteria bacterium AH-259-L09]MDA2937001.1 type I methionyl aminopeptidase [Acidobacteria bacterium AH-259-A15]